MTHRYDGVVLWSPGDEVAAISNSQHRRMVVYLEHQSPRAVFGAADAGVVHLFLGAPSAVVAGAELPQVVPVVLTALGYMQSGSRSRRINEDRLILSHRSGGQRKENTKQTGAWGHVFGD